MGGTGYILNDGIVMNVAGSTQEINSLEDLKKALDENKKPYMYQAQSLESLKEIGLTDEQIGKYFSSVQNSATGRVSYSLKYGLTAKQGDMTQEIRTAQQLYKAIKSGAQISTQSRGDVSITGGEAYFEQNLKDMGFSDKDIAHYFSKIEDKDGTARYVMCDGIVFNDAGAKEVTSLEDLKKALDAGKKTYMYQAQSLESLKKIGLTDEQIALYFSSIQNSATGSIGYSLKSGLVAKDGDLTQEIKTAQQLRDALRHHAQISNDKGDEFKLPPTRAVLNKKGFTDEQIDKYFDKRSYGQLSVATFTLKFGLYADTPDGKVNIKTPEELLNALNNGYNISTKSVEDTINEGLNAYYNFSS